MVRTFVGRAQAASGPAAAQAEAPDQDSLGPLEARTARSSLGGAGRSSSGLVLAEEPGPSSHKGPQGGPDHPVSGFLEAGTKNRLNAASLDSLVAGEEAAPKRRRVCGKRAVFLALDDVQFRSHGTAAASSGTASLPSLCGFDELVSVAAEAPRKLGPHQGSKRRPPAKTAKDKAARKRQRDEAHIAKQNQPYTWKCPAPNCGWSKSGKYGSVMAHKNKHWEARHPDLPKSLIFTKAEKISAIPTSPLLPASSRDWNCPICKEGLPKLDSGRRLASIRQHCDDRHPGETPSSLYHMKQRNSSNRGSGKRQEEVHAAARAAQFPSHSLVRVCPPERLAKGERGCLYYCRQCLTPIGKKNWTHQYTCEQIQQRLSENESLQRLRRSWWLKLKSKEPKHAKALSCAVGLSFAALDERCWVHQAHSERSRKLARSRFLSGVRPLRRKYGKQSLTRGEAEKRRGDPAAPGATTTAKDEASGSSALAKARQRRSGYREAPSGGAPSAASAAKVSASGSSALAKA